MDPIQSILLLAVFLAGVLALLYDAVEGIINPVFRFINRAIVPPWDLNTFLHLESERPEPNRYYSFAEEAVVSMGHRYNGRFDQAILRFEGVPILEIVIERRFPSRNIPEIVRKEDMFQAGLYALALMERGVSCSSTRLYSHILYTESCIELCDCWQERELFRMRKGKHIPAEVKSEESPENSEETG